MRNLIYNGVIDLPIPKKTTIVGFTQNLPAKHPENVEIYSTKAVKAVNIWLEEAGSTLASKKLKAALKMNRRKKNRTKHLFMSKDS